MDLGDTEAQVVRGRSVKEIEARATDLLKAVAPECLVIPQETPIVKIFENSLVDQFGFANLIQDLPNSLEGVTNVQDKECLIASTVHSMAESGDGRSRFSIAHEIGHVDLHRNELGTQLFQLMAQGQVLLRKRRELKAYEDPEWQANEYAACLLMPRQMVFKAIEGIRSTAEIVYKVMTTFAVSETAAKKRLQRLGVYM